MAVAAVLLASLLGLREGVRGGGSARDPVERPRRDQRDYRVLPRKMFLLATLPSLVSVGDRHRGAFIVLATTLWMAPKIASILGKTGMNVITRIMGLVIFSIAVEFIAKGLAELFPSLGHPV